MINNIRSDVPDLNELTVVVNHIIRLIENDNPIGR